MTDPPLKNDAAPLAGGAGVHCANTSSYSTHALWTTMPVVRNDAIKMWQIAPAEVARQAKILLAAVFSKLWDRGELGATDQEFQYATQLQSNTQIPVRWDLRNTGAVVSNGRNRETRKSCSATVRVLSEFALKPEGGAA